MISPQESGQAPNDAADYSWSPFGPVTYWRARCGRELSALIEEKLRQPAPSNIPGGANYYDGLLVALRIVEKYAAPKETL